MIKCPPLETLGPVEIAEYISRASAKSQHAVFTKLSPSLSVKVFEFLPFKVQQSIINSLDPDKTAAILREMAPDDRTAFLEELPSASVNELLKLLPLSERSIALKLLGYPENSVGRLMTTDYIAVKPEWTIHRVLDHIRKYGHDSETIAVIYVVDAQGKLIDDIRVRQLLLAPLDAKISEIEDHKFLSLSVNDDDETAVKLFRKHERAVLPVTDKEGILIGIVTVDDIMLLMTQESTEDIQKIGGSSALEFPYMETAFLPLMQKRAGWLILLFVGELFTATAMSYFEMEIQQAVVLALFLPLIISSGGNSGSQASSLIIRALAIDEITLKDSWRVIRREVAAGLFLGTLLGLIGFFRISIWSTFSTIYGPHWLLVATTIFAALIGVVLWGTLSGALLPLLLKKLGFDPAASSAPLVATLVDVTGIIIYFVTAEIILRGTLL